MVEKYLCSENENAGHNGWNVIEWAGRHTETDNAENDKQKMSLKVKMRMALTNTRIISV